MILIYYQTFARVYFSQCELAVCWHL